MLTTAFPVSAAPATLPSLVITEVCVDTVGWSGYVYDVGDEFEFIEIYNAGTTAVNLYDYSMVIGTATVGADPSTKVIEKVNPIQQSGNPMGTIATNNDPQAVGYQYYPTNPNTAVLQPGKTAVIWFCQSEAAVAAVYGMQRAITINDFKKYYRMNEYSKETLDDILVVAVDANCYRGYDNRKGAWIPSKLLGIFDPYGCTSNANDLTGFNGRFDLFNDNSKVYGIVKTSDITKDGNGNPTSKISECVSYAYANYVTKDITKNMVYKYSQDIGQGGFASIADISYNYKYSDGASVYNIGKEAGAIKYADWDCMKFATPGILLGSQVDNLIAHGSIPSTNLRYVQKRVPYNDSSIPYTVYQENFFAMEDSDEEHDVEDSDKLLEVLGWEKGHCIGYADTIKYSIKDEKLIADNLDASSVEGGVIIFPSIKMEKIARSDYTIEYELTYLDSTRNDRYCGIIFNFNGISSYDIFTLRTGGFGYNQRRIGANVYIAYEDYNSIHFGGNNDTVAGRTSVINKITNGEIKVKTTAGTDTSTFSDEKKIEYAPLLGRTINIRIEVNQVTGPEYYINDILVSKAATILENPSESDSAIALHPFWGAQTNYNEFAIGLYVSNLVKVAIDNIKVTGYVNEYTEMDILRTYNDAQYKEPDTGDSTIYAVGAMTVSFISIVGLVKVKRSKNKNI